MEEFLGKKYKLTKSDNFEEFMKAVGMGLMARKIVGLLSPVVELKKEGDEYSLITTSTFRTMTLVFKLGEEFEEEKPDGTKAKNIITIDGNKLLQNQTVNDKKIIFVREFTANEMTCVMTVGDIVATRVHTLVE